MASKSLISSNFKQILVITGPRGRGKTAFMANLYKNYILAETLKSSSNLSMSSFLKPDETNVSYDAGSNNKNSDSPLYLFYFLKPKDHLKSIIIDITRQMRLKYTNKGLSRILNLFFNK